MTSAAPRSNADLARAGRLTAAWIAAALIFSAGVRRFLGPQAFEEYLSVYLIEWSMSLDNLIVISTVIVAAPPAEHAFILRWGLLGTVAARLVMVTAGVGLVGAAHWLFHVFGAFLIALGLKMFSPRLDVFGRLVAPLKRLGSGGAGRAARLLPSRFKTPAALAVLAVIGYGVVFALDSVPAALAVSKNGFVIFSANAFSVMGLGALFYVIEWLEKRFKRLPMGVAAVLVFVGLKMIVEPLTGRALGAGASFAVIAALLGAPVLYSLLRGE